MSIEREFVEAVALGEIREFAIRRLGATTRPTSEWDILVKGAIAIMTSPKAVPIYPRCKTCKWWQGDHAIPDKQAEHWRCDNEASRESVFVAGVRDFARHYTGGNFGCVHHENREEKPEPSPKLFDPEQVEKLKAVAEAAKNLCSSHTPEKTYFPQLETALKSAGYKV